MRCLVCNANLNDFESTRKHAVTGEYIDECNKCFRWAEGIVPVTERDDLAEFEEPHDWEEEYDSVYGETEDED